MQIATAQANAHVQAWLAAGWDVRETNANGSYWWVVLTCRGTP